MFWHRKQIPQKIRVEPTLKRENLNELSDLEMQVLLRLANMKWPDNEHIDDWVLDTSASFEGKFNYILALMGALVRAELVKREMDKNVNSPH